jgi:hypothetical protein
MFPAIRWEQSGRGLTDARYLPLFDSGKADHFLFFVMPFVEGESLRQLLDRQKQLAVRDAVAIATKVADALDYAHERGMVHNGWTSLRASAVQFFRTKLGVSRRVAVQDLRTPA